MRVTGQTTGGHHGRSAAVVVGVGLLAVTGTSFAVEEVIVTTRKREENLQQVPIAVEALGAQLLQDRAVNDLAELTRQSPSLQFDTGFSPQDTRIAIRGLSPTRGRQNVAVLQDGIDVSSETVGGTFGGSLLINPRLFDVERVEIVKGPQVALYGRSAFAGALNYVTRAPGDELEGAVATELGNQGQVQFQGRVSGPLSDTFSAGVSGMMWNRDGFYTNQFTGERMGDQDGTSVAGTLRWRPTEKLDVKLRVENLNDEFGVTPFANSPFNPAFNGPFNQSFLVPTSAQQPINVVDEGMRSVVSPTVGSVAGFAGEIPSASSLRAGMSENPRTCTASGAPECANYPGTDRRINRGTLTLDWDLGPVLFTSLSHVADAKTSQWEGAEDVSANAAATPAEFILDNRTKLFSQELRLRSNNADSRVQWVGGALLWRENVDVEDGSYTCLNYGPFFSGAPCGPVMANILRDAPLNVPADGLTPLNADSWVRQTEHWSIYGLVEWQFLDKWKVAFEGRQTWEDMEARGPDRDNGIFDPSGNLCVLLSNFQAPPCPQTGPGTSTATGLTQVAITRGGEERDAFFAPKLTLTYTPTDNSLMYLSYAKTYKPKGISTVLSGFGAFFNRSCVEDSGGAPLPEQRCDPIGDFRFDRERLDYYEFGWKTDWFDRRLRINGSLFFQDFKNKQVSTQVTDPDTGLVAGRILNAGKAEILGAELEVTWQVTDHLTLTGAHTWLDTEYKEFISNTSGVGRIAYAGNCPEVVVFPRPRPDDPPVPGNTATLNCAVDYSGQQLERAPENSFFGNLRYQRNLTGSTDWFFEADAIYQDQRFTSEDNQMILPDYWLANFRAGIRNETWDVLAFVDNAFDDDTIKVAFNDGDIPTFFATGRFQDKATVTLPDLRLYGIRANYRFGRKQ